MTRHCHVGPCNGRTKGRPAAPDWEAETNCNCKEVGIMMRDFFLRSLGESSSPHLPKHCASFYLGCLDHLLKCGADEYLYELRTSHRAILVFCCHILMAPRTDDERESFIQSIEDCECDFREYDLHVGALHLHVEEDMPHGNPTIQGYLQALINIIYVCLCSESKIINVRKARAQALVTGSTPLWPADILELCPYGVQRSLEGLMQWAELCGSPQFFGLWHVIARFARFDSIPLIVSSPVLPWLAISKAAEQARRWEALGETYTADRAQECKNVIAHVGDFMNGMMAASARQLREFDARVRERDTALDTAAVFSRIVRMLPDLTTRLGPRGGKRELNTLRDVLVPLGGHIHEVLGLPADQSCYHPDILRASADCAEFFASPLSKLSGALSSLARGDTCGARGCAETEATAGRKFALCAGCGRVAYCSRACQKQGWRDAGMPHKEVCGMLQILVDAEGRPVKFLWKEATAALVKKLEDVGVTDQMAQEILRLLPSKGCYSVESF